MIFYRRNLSFLMLSLWYIRKRKISFENGGFMPKTIMLVDDIMISMVQLKEALELKGFKVVMYDTPLRVLEFAKLFQPDLILLDIVMPQMSGIEVCEQLKSDEKTKSIPVIFLTALAQKKEVVKGVQAGAENYIVKPYHFEELFTRIVEVIGAPSGNDYVDY